MTTQINFKIAATVNLVEADNLDKRSLTYRQLILCSVVVGIVGGLVATVDHFILERMTHGI